VTVEQPLPELDAVIHSQGRLRVTVALSVLPPGDTVTFHRLQELLGMTAGNLSTHLRKLEDAGYVTINKTYQHRKPVTYVSLSNAGRLAFEDYGTSLHDLLSSPKPGQNGAL